MCMCGILPKSQKNCCLFNLLQLEETGANIHIFAYSMIKVNSMMKVLASKCMHNFPPHLSCDLTLPGNMLTWLTPKKHAHPDVCYMVVLC